jgi:selenocysteine lyase/cysteine desulfurase
MLADGLRARLGVIRGVTLRDLGTERSGLVSFTVEGLGAQEVQARLAREQITVGANGVPYTPLDMTARNLIEIIRASVSYINAQEEIDRLAAVVARIGRGAG